MADRARFLAERRENLRAAASPRVNGIDYIEVDMATRVLNVHLVHPAPGPALSHVPRGGAVQLADISITGGDRIRVVVPVRLTRVSPKVLQIEVAALGDFSSYSLHISHAGFDEMLSRMDFGFRVECPSDFDCKADEAVLPAHFPSAEVNYLAKDFESYRQLMLDRIALLSPDWQDRDVPDTGITLVELMAHYADHLSYAQDAAGSEAYIGTARRRASVRRHAQLLGYAPHDGLSAKAFVQVKMAGAGVFARNDLLFLTNDSGSAAPVVDKSSLNVDALLAQGVRFYEPLDLRIPGDVSAGEDEWMPRPIALEAAQNALVLYDWADPEAVLHAGSTEAWIMAPAEALSLKAGDFISLELIRDPTTKRVADAEAEKRQIVCLISAPEAGEDRMVVGAPVALLKLRWHPDDALRFDLPVGRVTGLSAGDTAPAHMAMAYGNIVLVEHGVRFENAETLPLADADDDPELADSITVLSALDRPRVFQPRLKRRDISVGEVLHLVPSESAVGSLLQPRSRQATKAIWLTDGHAGPDWQALNSLLFSREDDRVFVPETEADGQTQLRFGQAGGGGAMPGADAADQLRVHYRIGIGRAGNVGAEAIGTLALSGAAGPLAVRNPRPAFGGRDRESVQEIKLKALAGLDDNHRAVIREDYVRLAMEHPKVQRALVRTIGHGSWTTFVIAIDPVGGIEVSDTLLAEVTAHLEPYRLMGQDIVVEAPRYAPLELALRLCILPEYLESDVFLAVQAQLSARQLPSGNPGFFHPDRLSFGAPIYLSRLIAAVREVAGVADVSVETFRKWRANETLSLARGVLQVDPAEIPLLMNDPNFPERGVLRLLRWETA